MLHFALFVLVSFFKSRRRLLLENALLRYQVGVLKRKQRRPLLRPWDRAVLVWLSKNLPSWKNLLTLVEPETVIRWHRKGFVLFRSWQQRKGGRRPIDPAVVNLIREISGKNPRWGTPRIHGELIKLGINICETTVEKYRHSTTRRNGGQNWRTFLKNHAKETIAIDFFIVPSIRFRMLWALVILSHDRREILHTAVTSNPSSPWTAQQLRNTFAFREFPKYLIHDRDRIFRGLSKLGMHIVRTSFRSPWQNAFVERVIGTIRRECTDHIIPMNEKHLERILRSYAKYYNRTRTHLSLGKDSPLGRPIKRTGRITSIPHVGGLHHEFTRQAA